MDLSPFPAAVVAGVDFDWLPESMKLFVNSSVEVSDSCGDGSPTSPPQPQPQPQPQPANIIPQTLPFLNPSNYSLQRTVSSSASDILLRGSSFFAAGDFQKKNQGAESPVSCESSITIEGMSRACRYSPEEKKERIERYRTKRNQRNFNKKIKYACRKSLADSRPRIRGRFARYNDDVVKNYPVQWSHGQEEEEEEENGGDNWIKYFMDAYSANLIP